MSRENAPLLDDRSVEQLLAGSAGPATADLQPAVALLRSLRDGAAPRATPALTDLLEHGFEPAVVPVRRKPARRWTARVGGVLAAAAASLLVAGTANALPAPLQGGVADLVGLLTPFELPRPVPAGSDPASGPAPADDAVPTATAEPSDVPRDPAARSAAPASATDDDARDDRDDTAEDRTPAERAERDRQRAAERAERDQQRAAEDAQDEARDEAEDAADEAEDWAEDEADEAEDEQDEAEDEQRDREKSGRGSGKDEDRDD